ncbi:RmlC-like cupin domain-containing protein [Phaeosphaeriaceae sp. PMI808]|nr:RmlC-like cupin domain-containing protein [Phaeosphaeriaceae sp. PMI808]
MALLGLSASVLAAPQHLTRETTPNQLSLTAQLTLADSAADRYNLLSKDSDFVYDWNKPGANPFANRKSFPALVGTGVALAYAEVPPCSFSAIHVHPRANELVTIVEGRLTNYMIPEFGVVNANGTIRVVINELSSGMAILNPQGALHTLYNYDCEPVKGVAAFSSEDEGITVIPNSLFATPDAIVAGQLGGGVSDDQVDNLRKIIKANRFGIQECQKMCNATMRRH